MLITGATGFLGRHVVLASERDRWSLIAPGRHSLDVRDRRRVISEIGGWRPDAVAHLAYRRDDPRTIIEGSRNVAEATSAIGARLVHVSTDLVFAGRARPYTEDDRPDATLDYGRWKAEAEAAVTEDCPTAVIVRPSLLYGTDLLAPCQHDVEEVLRGRRTMAFFTDEYRCATHADDVAAAIIALAARPEVVGPLHVAAARAISRAELAQRFATRFGGGTVPTSSLAASGQQRPGHLALDCSRAEALGLHCREIDEALGR